MLTVFLGISDNQSHDGIVTIMETVTCLEIIMETILIHNLVEVVGFQWCYLNFSGVFPHIRRPFNKCFQGFCFSWSTVTSKI